MSHDVLIEVLRSGTDVPLFGSGDKYHVKVIPLDNIITVIIEIAGWPLGHVNKVFPNHLSAHDV